MGENFLEENTEEKKKSRNKHSLEKYKPCFNSLSCCGGICDWKLSISCSSEGSNDETP